MVLGNEEELVYKISVDGRQLKHVFEFRYLGFVLDDSQMEWNGAGKW